MKLKTFIPFAIFCVICGALFVGLSLNPSRIPSELINDPIPEFSMPKVGIDEVGFTSADIIAEDGVVIVNFFASWCLPCYIEHPFLMELEKRGYKIYGVAYKDKAHATNRFLEEQGDPYFKTAADRDGRVAIEWGVYGFPETFVIKDGVILYKHAGPIMEMQFEDEFMPILESVAQ
ncbi:MAG: DsbE family thiol:disulfide interchange protein [Emcibacteraceae bacterium]|nr:DsbE family thiol:disulfide interchange protein [Emcibacteraceae bacterium]MDG1858680.1 DsbE family thiol:disulfide interchange protein [Emcibacteraceae bacterium]